MQVYLMRHGIAAPGHPDAARTLTPEGTAQMRLQAVALRHAGLHVERVLSSPYRRARETADLVAPALGLAVEEAPRLRCGFGFADALDLLGTLDGVGGVLLVGHQPDLGSVVHGFTGQMVPFLPGTLVALDVRRLQPYGGVLEGVYAPAFLARLGHALADEQTPGID